MFICFFSVFFSFFNYLNHFQLFAIVLNFWLVVWTKHTFQNSNIKILILHWSIGHNQLMISYITVEQSEGAFLCIKYILCSISLVMLTYLTYFYYAERLHATAFLQYVLIFLLQKIWIYLLLSFFQILFLSSSVIKLLLIPKFPPGRPCPNTIFLSGFRLIKGLPLS